MYGCERKTNKKFMEFYRIRFAYFNNKVSFKFILGKFHKKINGIRLLDNFINVLKVNTFVKESIVGKDGSAMYKTKIFSTFQLILDKIGILKMIFHYYN